VTGAKTTRGKENHDKTNQSQKKTKKTTVASAVFCCGGNCMMFSPSPQNRHDDSKQGETIVYSCERISSWVEWYAGAGVPCGQSCVYVQSCVVCNELFNLGFVQ
jgi:hypothetical protein